MVRPDIYTRPRLPSNVKDAISTYTAKLSPQQRLGLTWLVFDEMTRGTPVLPDTSYLEAIEFSEMDTDLIFERLVEAYSEATRNEQRKYVLTLWRHLDPVSERVRLTLTEKIYLPLLRVNKTAFDIALRNLNLVLSLPRNAQERVAAELLDAAPDGERERRARRRLESADLVESQGVLKRLMSRGRSHE